MNTYRVTYVTLGFDDMVEAETFEEVESFVNFSVDNQVILAIAVDLIGKIQKIEVD